MFLRAFCIAVSVYTSACRFAERAVLRFLGTVLSILCVHHIYRAGSIDSVGRSRSPKNA